ncbi:MAG: YceH family protein [Acidobacteriota bacterium]|nr:YceH family protein [Acidobacteriota bacterium]
MPIPLLDEVEVRVLGTLIEKEATTPEYYPLSLNALVNGCNQKSNRDPVVNYDAESVEAALEGLREKKLALFITGSGRVGKYAQRISESFNLGRRESAVLCTLLLRGPQTLGEIKDRSERMFAFGDLSETEVVLEKLSEWEGGPLVRKLGRQPGQKEARYAHLLGREPLLETSVDAPTSAPAPGRVAQLEAELQQFRSEFEDLKARFNALEAQLR